jgi:hypothetical protein
MLQTRDDVVLEVATELYRATQKHGPMHSWHEAYAVIREELDVFWESVKANDPGPEELIQIAAMAQRALLDLVCVHARNYRARPVSPAPGSPGT